MRHYKLLLLLILLSIITWVVVHHHSSITPELIKQKTEQFGALSPLVFIVIYAFGVIVAIPGIVLTLAGGILFGPLLGVAYNMTGAIIGASIAFLLSRYLGADFIAKKSGKKLKIIISGIEKEGWRFMALLRLSPIVPFNMLNYALGLTKIDFNTYFIASFLCMLPGCVAYTYLGHVGIHAASGQKDLIEKILLALFLLALATYAPRALKLLKRSSLS